MDIGVISTTLFDETVSYINTVIEEEELVSRSELSSYNYVTALTETEIDTLFPIVNSSI